LTDLAPPVGVTTRRLRGGFCYAVSQVL